MGLRKVITLALYNRPQYTRNVVEALKACAGIEDYVLLPHIEPGCEEVIEIVRSIEFAEVAITINPFLFGIGLNTFRTWEHAFQHADFLVHMEDDTVPAPDCLKFFESASEFGLNDSRILSITAYNREPCGPHEFYSFSCRPAFNCWIVGIWRSRWDWISSDWNPDPRRYANYLATRAQSESLLELYPLLSRSQNIGAEGGVHVESAEWHRLNQHTEHWSGNYSLPPGEFKFRDRFLSG